MEALFVTMMAFYKYLALMLVLEIVESISALSVPTLLQIVQEGVVGGVPVALLLHRYHLLVLDVEDAVAVLLRLLDLLKDGFTLICHSYSGRHGGESLKRIHSVQVHIPLESVP